MSISVLRFRCGIDEAQNYVNMAVGQGWQTCLREQCGGPLPCYPHKLFQTFGYVEDGDSSRPVVGEVLHVVQSFTHSYDTSMSQRELSKRVCWHLT